MRKLVLVIALILGGCGPGGFPNFLPKGPDNPITKDMLYKIEVSAAAATSGLNSYKRLCVQQLIADNCRGTINAIQVYTRQIPPYLTALRKFVKENDQVNAIVVYNNLTQLLVDIKRTKGEA